MKRLSPIWLLAVIAGALLAHAAARGTPSTASQDQPAAGQSETALPVDLENARKAKAVLEQAIQALGGQAYLTVRDMQMSGRTYSFHHGRPTSNGVQFWRFIQYPDKDRIEITK